MVWICFYGQIIHCFMINFWQVHVARVCHDVSLMLRHDDGLHWMLEKWLSIFYILSWKGQRDWNVRIDWYCKAWKSTILLCSCGTQKGCFFYWSINKSTGGSSTRLFGKVLVAVNCKLELMVRFVAVDLNSFLQIEWWNYKMSETIAADKWGR
jgi:hypothetical protein